MKRILSWILTTATVIGLLSTAPATAQTTADGQVTTLSRKLVEPLSKQGLLRRYAPTQIRLQSQSAMPVGENTTRLFYTWRVQLPDGSQLNIPRTFDVERKGNTATTKLPDLTVYEVRRWGDNNKLIKVGLAPDRRVVYLEGPTPNVPGFW